MSLRIPPRPMSTNAEGRYQRRLLEHAQRHQSMGHVNGAVDSTTHGTLARRLPTPVSTGGGTTISPAPLGMVFRGEWHSSLNYSAQDVVTIVGGNNAGLYVCVEPVAAGGPEPGTGGTASWVKISGDDFTIWR